MSRPYVSLLVQLTASELSSWLTQPWQVTWWPFRLSDRLKRLLLVSYVLCVYFRFTHRLEYFVISYWSPIVSLFLFDLSSIWLLHAQKCLLAHAHGYLKTNWPIFNLFCLINTLKFLLLKLTLFAGSPLNFCILCLSLAAKSAIQGWSTYLGYLFSDRCALASLFESFCLWNLYRSFQWEICVNFAFFNLLIAPEIAGFVSLLSQPNDICSSSAPFPSETDPATSDGPARRRRPSIATLEFLYRDSCERRLINRYKSKEERNDIAGRATLQERTVASQRTYISKIRKIIPYVSMFLFRTLFKIVSHVGVGTKILVSVRWAGGMNRLKSTVRSYLALVRMVWVLTVLR